MHHETQSLEETPVAETHYFAGTNIVSVGEYDFTVNTFYPEDAGETAIEKLCAEVAPQIIRTLAKRNQKVLPSSRKMPCGHRCGKEVDKL